MKKIICLLLSLLLMGVGLGQSVTANDAGVLFFDLFGNDDEKIYSNATPEDDFEPDCVLVVLKHSYSMENLSKVFTPEDFPGVGCEEVVDIMYSARELVIEKLRRRAAIESGELSEAEWAELSTIEIEPETFGLNIGI